MKIVFEVDASNHEAAKRKMLDYLDDNTKETIKYLTRLTSNKDLLIAEILMDLVKEKFGFEEIRVFTGRQGDHPTVGYQVIK